MFIMMLIGFPSLMNTHGSVQAEAGPRLFASMVTQLSMMFRDFMISFHLLLADGVRDVILRSRLAESCLNT